MTPDQEREILDALDKHHEQYQRWLAAERARAQQPLNNFTDEERNRLITLRKFVRQGVYNEG